MEPEVIAPQVIEAGANRVSVQVESRGQLQRSLTYIRSLGAQPGVAVSPAVPLEMIAWVLDDIDYVLLLSVNPGYSGQSFIPASLGKLEALAKMIRGSGRDISILVDGAVEPENVGELARRGANDFVSGSGLFDHRPLAKRVRAFREAMG